MFRSLVVSSSRLLRPRSLPSSAISPAGGVCFRGLRVSHHEIHEADFEEKMIAYFEKPDLDGWDCRRGFAILYELDLVPEPKVMIAGLKACRKLNDYALAIRFLEATRMKCATHVDTIWPYIIQEIGPTMKEMGISPLEEMGYDKPELALPNPYKL